MGQPVTITPDQPQSQTGPVTITPDAQPGTPSGFLASDPRTVPNARIRNMTVDPTKDTHSAGQALYEGAKTGLELGSIPSVVDATIPGLLKGAAGATVGSVGAKAIAKAAGAGDFGQEVAGDVGGLAGGGFAAGTGGSGKIAQSMDAITKPGRAIVEDLPVVGSVVKGVKATKNVAGDLADIWAKKPVYPGAPNPEAPPAELAQASALFRGASSPPDPAAALGTVKSGSVADAIKDPGAPLPEKPSPELLKARALFEGSSSPPDPAAGLGTIKQSNATPGQAGSIASSMEKPAQPAPNFSRGSLGDLLDQSLGAKKLNPKVPLRQQMDVVTPTSSRSLSSAAADAGDVPEGHTPHQSSALRSSKYDADANEFHARMTSGDTTYVYGDVSPEEADAFSSADSKGKAYQQIKGSHPLVAKIVGGKRMPVKAAAN